MKHLIIGSGVIGKATGTLLKANKEEVVFYDIKSDILNKLKKNKYEITDSIDNNYDVFWICTAEWNVDDVFKILTKKIDTWSYKKIIIIRSTVPPGETEILSKKYSLKYIAHMPEFLREATAVDDAFNPDRIIIGCSDKLTIESLLPLFKRVFPDVPIVTTDPTTSELIKLASNAWLSTQISFWNEIFKVCNLYNVNPQEVSTGCTLDKRISKYGSKMTGSPFEGFCLPKDIISMKNAFKNKKVTSQFLDMISNINKEVKK